MKVKTIEYKGKYLSENMGDFPFAPKGEILFFDKGRTGCGGTTLAGQTVLRNDTLKVIVVMPSVASVMSKEIQSDFKGNRNVQFLYRNIKLSGSPSLIFCTYDKLKAVSKKLGTSTKEYKLLIDEYHSIVRDAAFRSVMFDLIKNLDIWESVTLMSATSNQHLEEVVKRMYPDKIQKTQIIWKNYIKEVVLTETDDVLGSLCLLIHKCIRGELDLPFNLYLFYNNIANSNKLIERCELKSDFYHFLCSSKAKIVPDKSTISQINKDPRRINFITAAGFEGLDIHDPNALPIVVIDMSAPSTIFDWQTIMQVAGRCRETFAALQILYRQTNGYRRDMLLPVQQKSEVLYSLKCEGKEINPFDEAIVAHSREILNNMQSFNAVKKYLERQGYKVIVRKQQHAPTKVNGKRIEFRKLCEMYNNGCDITGYHNSILAKQAIKGLGMPMLNNLGFKPKSVKRALKIIDMNGFDKPIESIMGLTAGVTYSNRQIRERIEDVNKILGTNFDTTHVVVTLTEMGYMVKERRLSDKLEYIILKSVSTVRHSRHSLYITHVTDVPFLSLKLSVAKHPGNKCRWMNKGEMYDLYYLYSSVVPQKKEDQIYISGCYSLTERSYCRRQDSFDACDILILDVDNGKSIDEFNDYMAKYYGNALHYIYTTFSHNEALGIYKYRVLIPLSHTLILKRYEEGIALNESISAYKKVKAAMFPDFQDPNCPLWVYASASEIKEYGDQTVLLNADYLADWIEECVIIERALNSLSAGGSRAVFTAEQEAKAIQIERARHYKSRLNADKIIEIINNAQVGERDNTIFRMAMVNLDSADVDKVRAGIYDPEKLKMYDEKLKRRRLYNYD